MNGSSSNGTSAAVLAYLAGAISVGDVNDVLGVAAAVTGLSVGLVRYATVLRGESKKQVDHKTAAGFFFGLFTSAVVIVSLAIL